MSAITHPGKPTTRYSRLLEISTMTENFPKISKTKAREIIIKREVSTIPEFCHSVNFVGWI